LYFHSLLWNSVPIARGGGLQQLQAMGVGGLHHCLRLQHVPMHDR